MIFVRVPAPSGPCVTLVHAPGTELQFLDSLHQHWIASVRQPGPFIDDRLGAEVWVPCEAPKTIQVCHRQRTAEPIRIHADIRDPGEASNWTMKGFSADQILDRARFAIRPHVEIEDFFPHRNQKTEMLLLTRIFLRDLQLDGFIRALQTCEERRYWLAHLEIDRTVLDLDDYVVVERAIERMKIVIRRFRSIIF